jgi:rfaE bifunctional protein nucleotidyltransferase chain/domain
MDIATKIHSINEISSLVDKARRIGKKIVHCHGEFDLLHLGHTRYFKAAKKMGDLLVVTLTPDRFITKGPGRPVFNEDLRAEAIANLEFVDCVGINEWETAEETLHILKPDIYVKGSEYLDKIDVTGRLEMEKKIIESLGGKMEFTHEIIFSSSKLLNNHFDVFTRESQPFLKSMAEKYNAMDIVSFLDQLKTLKILAIGEGQIDRHYVTQISPLSSRPEVFGAGIDVPHGALICASVLSDLCDHVDLVCLSGSEISTFENYLPEQANQKFFPSPCVVVPIVTKYIDRESRYCQFQVASQKAETISDQLEKQILEFLSDRVAAYDCVLLFDRSLGLFTEKISDLLSEESKFLGISSLETDLLSLSKFRNIDYLGLISGFFAESKNRAAVDAVITKIGFRQPFQDEIFISGEKGLSFWDDNEFMYFPPFTGIRKTDLNNTDLASLIFSVLAPLNFLNINHDCLKLVGNALFSLVSENSEIPFKLDRLLLDKFIIALLNR